MPKPVTSGYPIEVDDLERLRLYIAAAADQKLYAAAHKLVLQFLEKTAETSLREPAQFGAGF